MQRMILLLSSVCLTLVTTYGTTTPDPGEALVGRWEYRQRAGEGYDPVGEIIEFTRDGDVLEGVYFGLERTGEHGLYFTVVKLRDLTITSEGEVSFTVPERDLFRERLGSLQDTLKENPRSAGYTRYELQMKGSLEGDRLLLHCTSDSWSCPADTMVFKKGRWSPD